MILVGEKVVRGRQLATRTVRRQGWELEGLPLAVKGRVEPHDRNSEQRENSKE